MTIFLYTATLLTALDNVGYHVYIKVINNYKAELKKRTKNKDINNIDEFSVSVFLYLYIQRPTAISLDIQ